MGSTGTRIAIIPQIWLHYRYEPVPIPQFHIGICDWRSRVSQIEKSDLAELRRAKQLLENPGLAAKMSAALGAPIEKRRAVDLRRAHRQPRAAGAPHAHSRCDRAEEPPA